MKRAISLLIITASLVFANQLKADEGMWLPMFIHKYNIDDMQSKGFKLSAEDIYSINQPSLKDAIVIFGRGCTGEVISPEGLLITNHHCGFGVIQRHSTIENDYLSYGFWAMSREEELPSPGLTVRFLVWMDDVTQKVLNGVTPDMDETQRELIVERNSKLVVDSVTKDTHYIARIAPLFYGNQYFVWVYEEFTDVRLVGAPPSSIGKFGGDTDNWMWPRHTGDFALFRIYADKDNKPARYSPENVPYKPKKFLPISLKGIDEGDFTMVFGYPGTTEQFITSQAVSQVVNVSNPLKISLRDERLKIMDSYMRLNDTVRIQYANKQAGVANAWKKWIGERNGLIRLNAVEKKQEFESQFASWVSQSADRTKEYVNLLPQFESLYQKREPLLVASDLGREAFKSVELIRFASQFTDFVLNSLLDTIIDTDHAQRLIGTTRSFYKDFHEPIDRKVFASMISEFDKNLNDTLKPPLLNRINTSSNGNWMLAANEIYGTSIFADSTELIGLLANFSSENALKLWQDVVFRLNFQFDTIFYSKVDIPFSNINRELNILYRSFVKGLMEMQPNMIFYPDANFTLRIAYGNVEGYSPSDAIDYLYLTTLDGIAEKSLMEVYDYEVPQRLIELYESKDYGRWEVDGTVPVAFIATNHTSGGNSGSPVINSEGHLIGINFDRVWEGTMSDIMFDPEMCRNISLDIRYALFIIDNFAGAGHLIEEMLLIE